MEVAAHSASPLFATRAQQDAAQLMELGIIDKTDFLDLQENEKGMSDDDRYGFSTGLERRIEQKP